MRRPRPRRAPVSSIRTTGSPPRSGERPKALRCIPAHRRQPPEGGAKATEDELQNRLAGGRLERVVGRGVAGRPKPSREGSRRFFVKSALQPRLLLGEGFALTRRGGS